jgi:ribonuclease HII
MSQLDIFAGHDTLSPENANASQLEDNLRKQGFRRIAGVDEAGRGPLAGPVVAACCILPGDFAVAGIRDSKLLTELERERLFELLTQDHRVQYRVSFVSPKVIDKINIRRASLLAMKRAVEQLDKSPELAPQFLLVDGRDPVPVSLPQKAIIKGDLHCISVAAASIIAKVSRDRFMKRLAKKYTVYNFESNKGYATEDHLAAIAAHGITEHHRKSFQPVRDAMSSESRSSQALF